MIELIAISVPIFLALCGAIVAGIRGAIRLGQYLERSVTAQDSIAKSNGEIRDTLKGFMVKTEDHFSENDRDIAVLKYAANRNNHDGYRRRSRMIDPADKDSNND